MKKTKGAGTKPAKDEKPEAFEDETVKDAGTKTGETEENAEKAEAGEKAEADTEETGSGGQPKKQVKPKRPMKPEKPENPGLKTKRLWPSTRD